MGSGIGAREARGHAAIGAEPIGLESEAAGGAARGSGSLEDGAREESTRGVDSEAPAGPVRQQFPARRTLGEAPAATRSQREQASVRAGIFIRQSIRPACAGGACARRSAPRARMEIKRRAFISPQSTPQDGRS
jgi:hypothetical protein